tara:strand:+ start:151 stop:450 length:300 start_codon:yes stop_codon:yes gene_type:complete
MGIASTGYGSPVVAVVVAAAVVVVVGAYKEEGSHQAADSIAAVGARHGTVHTYSRAAVDMAAGSTAAAHSLAARSCCSERSMTSVVAMGVGMPVAAFLV